MGGRRVHLRRQANSRAWSPEERPARGRDWRGDLHSLLCPRGVRSTRPHWGDSDPFHVQTLLCLSGDGVKPVGSGLCQLDRLHGAQRKTSEVAGVARRT